MENLTAAIRKVQRESRYRHPPNSPIRRRGCSVGWASANAGMAMQLSGRAR